MRGDVGVRLRTGLREPGERLGLSPGEDGKQRHLGPDRGHATASGQVTSLQGVPLLGYRVQVRDIAGELTMK